MKKTTEKERNLKVVKEQIEKNFHTQIHREATSFFDLKLWEATYGQYTIIHPEGGHTIFKGLHEEFNIEESKTHNCLACNLSESLWILGKFLSEIKENESEGNLESSFNYYFTVFILLLHLQTEKFFTLFKFLGITQRYQKENWKILQEINLWANFVKHPKGFLFCHHPIMYINEKQLKDWGVFQTKDIVILDYDNFIKVLYNHENEEKFYRSIKRVEGKTKVFLKVTSPIYMMERFAVFCESIFKVITENEFFKSQLIEKTSIENYWQKLK